MAIQLTGYTLLTHKIIPRSWGVECRFTAVRSDGSHVNDIIRIRPGISDDELSQEIQARLSIADAPPPPLPQEEPVYTESEVVDMLVKSGFLSSGSSLQDLQPVLTEVSK